jgi:hypothetical protein
MKFKKLNHNNTKKNIESFYSCISKMGDSKAERFEMEEEECFGEDPRGIISFVTHPDADSKDSSSFSSSVPSYTPRGVGGLDLSFASADRKSGTGDRDREGGGRDGGAVQEESVLVVFDLPDGSQGESNFRMGQTVEVLKSFVEMEFGIPMAHQTLLIEGKRMMDPLSLCDYPEAKGKLFSD